MPPHMRQCLSTVIKSTTNMQTYLCLSQPPRVLMRTGGQMLRNSLTLYQNSEAFKRLPCSSLSEPSHATHRAHTSTHAALLLYLDQHERRADVQPLFPMTAWNSAMRGATAGLKNCMHCTRVLKRLKRTHTTRSPNRALPPNKPMVV